MSFIRKTLPLTLLLALAGQGSPLWSQAPGVPIESQQPVLTDEGILSKAGKLREANELLSAVTIAEQLKAPKGGAIALLEPSKKVLRGREIGALARQASLRLGWYYKCQRCEKWHLNLAGAYAIAPDAIVTCNHCVEPKSDMREGFLIVVDRNGEVIPVTEVIARSTSMDAAILRVRGAQLKPLALQDDVAPGDPAFCFSDPLGQVGYFATGIVNRFYWTRKRAGAPGSLDELKSLRVNVSTDWAPGSSGSPVLDECGNAIGHVSTISPMSAGGGRAGGGSPEPGGGKSETPKSNPRGRDNAVMITLHEAVPARSIRALAQSAAKPSQTAEKPLEKDVPADGTGGAPKEEKK